MCWAHLAGVDGMPALNADTAYGPARFATALSATALLIVSAVVLGVAIARTSRQLRWHGIAYATLVPLFALSGFVLQPVQAISGFGLAAATAALALRLPRAAGQVRTTGVRRSPTAVPTDC
jgi:hypothetical protein